MKNEHSQVYDFAFRGLLSQEALDRAGRRNRTHGTAIDQEIADAISLNLLSDEFVSPARSMATVYAAIAAFENSVRKLISTAISTLTPPDSQSVMSKI